MTSLGLGVRAAFAERDHVVASEVAALTATALPPVPDPAQRGDAEQVVLTSDAHRADDEAVEHIRQSRLQRWQSQRD